MVNVRSKCASSGHIGIGYRITSTNPAPVRLKSLNILFGKSKKRKFNSFKALSSKDM